MSNNINNKNRNLLVSLASDGVLIDLIDHNGKTAFYVSKDGQGEVLDSVKINGKEYLPMPHTNNLLKHKVICLPTERQDHGDVNHLVDAIRSYIEKYLSVSEAALETIICYVLLTWVYEGLEEVPYLRFLGDLGSGKTRALKVLGSIVNKGFFASAASTISPIYYTLDLFKPTLILDEADMRYTDAANEVVKIYNNGTVRGMPVLRQTQANGQSDFEPRAFDVFGPKIVAMRRRFEDDGLESRFLTEEMQADQENKVPISLPKAYLEEAQLLRNMLLDYRHTHFWGLHIQEALIEKNRSGRFKQMLLPLLAVAPDEHTRSLILQFANRSDEKLNVMRSSSLEQIVKDVYQEFSQQQETIALSHITEEVRERVGQHERPITSKLVGSLLRLHLGIATWRRNGVFYCTAMKDNKAVD